MERTKRTPILILTSDWHLREDAPTCFIGDWDQEQWDSVLCINRLQQKYNCPVLHAGDLFHHWKPSPYLLTRTIKYLPDQFNTVYGQHDLPQHNLDLAIKSGINTLMEAGTLTVLSECHYGQEPKKGSLLIPNSDPDKLILVWHHMTYISSPFPGATAGQAQGTLMKYPQFDLIVTGDNHQSFNTEYKGRVLVNPGPITRQAADQIDFKPRVALYYEDGSIEWVYLPIQEGAISRAHLEVKEERDNRIAAFISKLDGEWETELSFEDNLEKFKMANDINDKIMDIIYRAIDFEKK